MVEVEVLMTSALFWTAIGRLTRIVEMTGSLGLGQYIALHLGLNLGGNLELVQESRGDGLQDLRIARRVDCEVAAMSELGGSIPPVDCQVEGQE